MTAAAVAALHLAALPLLCQGGGGHLPFKGVPLAGTVESFKEALAEKGMHPCARYAVDEDGMRGEYAKGRLLGRTVTVRIGYSPLSRTVRSVHTLLPARDEWEAALDEYVLFRGHFTAVHGEPSEREEGFDTPYREGDGRSIRALGEGKCRFRSVWRLPEGTVTLEIIPAGLNAQVLVVHTDGEGERTYRTEKLKTKNK